MEEFTCSMCHHFTAPNMGAVLRHIGSVHSHQAGFQVQCGIQGCPRTYKNYHSFRKHLRRKHSEAVGFETPSELHVAQSDTNADIWFGGMPVDTTEMIQNQHRASTALFVLKNREVHKISQVALNDLLYDVSMIVAETVDTLASRVSFVLCENGIKIENVNGLEEALSDVNLRNPFRGLKSSYLQRKVYCSLGLVVRCVHCTPFRK